MAFDLVSALQGLFGGLDPFANPPTSASTLSAVQMPNAYGSGGSGAPPPPFQSQDERSSPADRLGMASPASAPPTPPMSAPVTSADPSNWARIQAGIFKGEGTNGNYDTLFGQSQAPGGPFAGTQISNMTVDQAIKFADPSGPYGQWVKAHNHGVLATPMGAYQVVGSTLRGAKNGLGLTGNEQMTPELQDQIGKYILGQQGTAAWAGYHGPAQPGSYQNAEPRFQMGAGGGTAGGSGDNNNLGMTAQQGQDIASILNPNQNNFGTRLQAAFQQLGRAPQAPMPYWRGGGDARNSGDALLKALQSNGLNLTQLLTQQRLG